MHTVCLKYDGDKCHDKELISKKGESKREKGGRLKKRVISQQRIEEKSLNLQLTEIWTQK